MAAQVDLLVVGDASRRKEAPLKRGASLHV